MGIAVREIITSKEVSIDDLKDKILVVDTFNLLYQFLTTIRQRDGSLLTDSSGNVTSHLTGLFSRTANLLEKGLRLAFVFDGEAPDLKQAERQRRKDAKEGAQKEYEIAKERGDIEGMKKYASRTATLKRDMIEEAMELIDSLGCPVIQAPSEGEAQAAYIAKKEHVYTVSQDFDTLLHGSPYLIRNLSIAGKRKRTGKLGMVTVKPEMISLSENLNKLGIDNDQLIALSLLVGTDYNNGGVKGIGPKKALQLLKKHGKDFDALFEESGWDFDFPWTAAYYQIKNMPVTDDYNLEWKDVDKERVVELLCGKHDFSRERVENTLSKLGPKKQKGLGDFF